jgi:hypothetical protein
MNKKHHLLTLAQAIQRDLDAEGISMPNNDWPTKINSVDSSIWY